MTSGAENPELPIVCGEALKGLTKVAGVILDQCAAHKAANGHIPFCNLADTDLRFLLDSAVGLDAKDKDEPT